MRFILIFLALTLMATAAEPDYLARARALHKQAIVIDSHADTTLRLLDEGFDLAQDAGNGQVDLSRMREGGLGAEFFSIWVDPKRYGEHPLARGLAMIGAVLDQVDRHPKDLEQARTVADIRRIHAAGRIAVLMGVEGGHVIENDPRVLDVLYRLGVRYMTLTWSNSTSWAGSSGDEGRTRGLNEMGREIVTRMNRLGMMVDISHVSDPTFWDVMKMTKAPVIASHSSCRALCDVPRNMTDDMLRAMAKNGGVVQINYYEGFIDKGYSAGTDKLAAEMKQRQDELEQRWKNDIKQLSMAKRKLDLEMDAKLPRPDVARLADHVDHAVKVAGVDHVGLGSDFDGATMPRGLENVSKLPNLTAELMRRGYSDAGLTKILGGNLLRVMEQVERARKQ